MAKASEIVEKWHKLQVDSKGQDTTELECRAGERKKNSFESRIEQTVAKQAIDMLIAHSQVATWARFEIQDRLFALPNAPNGHSVRERTELCTLRSGQSVKENASLQIILKIKGEEQDFRVAGRTYDCRFALKNEKFIAAIPAGATRVSGRMMVRFSFWTKDGNRIDISEIHLTNPTDQLVSGREHYECEVERIGSFPLTSPASIQSSMEDWFAKVVPVRDEGLFMRLDTSSPGAKVGAANAATSSAAAAAASSAAVAAPNAPDINKSTAVDGAAATAAAATAIAKASKPQSAIIKDYFFLPWLRD